MAFRGPKAWLWRWRRNPLRRRVDVVEAWVVVAAWLVTLVAGVLAGLAATASVEHGLARERVEWRQTVALLTEKAPGKAADRPAGATGRQVWGRVRWKGQDGSRHTGQVRVGAGSAAGSAVTVWTDPHGELVTKPPTASQARMRSVLIGVLVGLSAAAVPFVGGRVLCGRLERRRMARWDAEWARFGPRWGRNTL
ncbi:Rv1733c family protein [Streptomyces sediminimaris]|uniref:Rv1733c family protein n=1 Tax=Streptomyces sediminimaris TaxID=3383721 RepID=UPI00399BA6C2